MYRERGEGGKGRGGEQKEKREEAREEKKGDGKANPRTMQQLASRLRDSALICAHAIVGVAWLMGGSNELSEGRKEGRKLTLGSAGGEDGDDVGDGGW